MNFSKFASFQTGPASPRTTMIGMIVAASILLVLALLTTRMAYVLDQTGERAQARVIRIIDAGDDMHRAVFQFTDSQGHVHTLPEGMRSSYKRFDVGEIVSVVFDKNDPGRVRRDSALWLYFFPAILGLMSTLFFGGAALVWRFRSHLQKDYETRRGKTIVTVIDSDGSVTQKSYGSGPVYRWTGVFLSGLGIVAWLGAIVLIFQGSDAGGRFLAIGFSGFFLLLGGLLLLGASALRRHAEALEKLD